MLLELEEAGRLDEVEQIQGSGAAEYIIVANFYFHKTVHPSLQQWYEGMLKDVAVQQGIAEWERGGVEKAKKLDHHERIMFAVFNTTDCQLQDKKTF